MDERLQQLRHWLENTLDVAVESFEPASVDASFRRYFRIACAAGAGESAGETSGDSACSPGNEPGGDSLGGRPLDKVRAAGRRSLIAMDAPPAQEDVPRFLSMAERLRSAEVHVPAIIASDPAAGFVLMSDLGSSTFLAALEAGHEAGALYRSAIATLVQMQLRAPTDGLPPYDERLLRKELQICRDWYLGRHCGMGPGEVADALPASVEDLLVESASSQPHTFVHRDFHSRNLMLSEPWPGVLDFQDAVAGPAAYDLVSLLRDCYVAWPDEMVAGWLGDYLSAAQRAGIPGTEDAAAFRQAFDLCGVQRHLKAIGIFARLRYRDGKPHYIADIPRVLEHLRAVAADYPRLEPLQCWLTGPDENSQ